MQPLIISIGVPDRDIAFAPDLERLLQPTYSHPNVIVDLSDVEFIHSTCLGQLIRMRKERLQRGLKLERLIVSTENIRHVFSIVRFDRIWPLYRSLSEAMAA